MPSNAPEPKYRCSKCQFPYAYMMPDGKCPCGGKLVDINQFLKNADDIWDQSVFDSFPCVIAHEYKRLYDLSQSSNIYGVFLQLRDVIETTVKFIVLLSVSWGKYKDVNGREEAYEKYLATPRMSLGAWNTIAEDYLIPFYGERINTSDSLPDSLWNVLSMMTEWIKDNKLITWRNEKLGHGAIGFEDDPVFQQELYNVIKAVGEFYQKHYTAFTSIQLASNHKVLQGFRCARDLPNEKGKCSAFIDGKEISTDPLIIHEEHGIYFFDEIKRKKRLRMLNYQTGYDKILANDYAAELLRMSNDQTTLLQASPESDFLTRAENDFLTRLGSPEDFVEPEYLTKWLKNDVLKNHTKGVFLVEMERGCGKSVYTERLNRRFYGPLELEKDLDVRTYHLGRTQIGGLREFTQGVMEEWNTGFVEKNETPDADLKRYAVLEEDREHPENNALRLAEYLKKLQQYTATCYARGRKKKIMLVLDGLDEISAENDVIWSFLPDTDLLENGVYILLTTRMAEEKDLPQKYWDHLAALHIQDRKAVSAKSMENTGFLEQYIRKQGLKCLDDEKINNLILLAEHRILYLSLLCSQYKTIGTVDVSKEKSEEIVGSFLKMIERQYSETQKALFRKVLCSLSCVACFETLTIKEISEIVNLSSITFALLDIMTDLLPILRIDRGLQTNEGLTSSENRFSLRDDVVERLVKEHIGIDQDLFISSKIFSFREEYNAVDHSIELTMGDLAVQSHFVSFAELSGEGIEAGLIDFDCCCASLALISKRYIEKNEIVKIRELNLQRQIISIHKGLSEKDRADSADAVWDVCIDLAEKLRNIYALEEAARSFEYAESLLDITDRAELEVGVLYQSLGVTYKALGLPRAKECLQKALELLGKYTNDDDCTKLHAVTQSSLADLCADYHEFDEAKNNYIGALREVDSLLQKNREDPKLYSLMFHIRTQLANTDLRYGNGDVAEMIMRELRDFIINGFNELSFDDKCSLAYVDSELALVIQRKDQSDETLAEAYRIQKEALEIYTQASEIGGMNVDLDLARVHNNLGKTCRAMEKNEEAFEHYYAALKIYEEYKKKSPALYNVDVAMISMNIANLMFGNFPDRMDEALPYYQKAYDIYLKLYTNNPKLFSKEYALICLNMGSYYLKWRGELYTALEFLKKSRDIYQQLFTQSPAEYKSEYVIALYNLGLVYQLMIAWNSKEAINFYTQYCRLVSDPGVIVTKYAVLEFAKEVLEEQANSFVLCPMDHMTRENGWSKDGRAKLLELRKKTNVKTVANAEVRKKAREEYGQLSEFNQSEAKKAVNLVKMHYGRIMEAISKGKIRNGSPDQCCGKAKELRVQGLYPDACAVIEEQIVTSHRMTTGTAYELFMILTVSGALRDAIDLVSFMFDKCQAGVIDYDEYVSSISNLRFVLYACIEEYDGLTIIPLLTDLSESNNYCVQKEDLDIKLRSGEFLPIIRSTMAHVPAAKEMIKEFKKLLKE